MRTLLFLIIFGGLALSSTAQVGVKAGVNISTFAEEGQGYSRSDVESRSVTTPVLGLTFEANLGILSLQPELIYTQLGSRNTYNVLGTTTERSYRINYVEVPVLAKLKLGNENRNGIGIYLAAGPWLGFGLSGKYKNIVSSNGTNILETERDYSFDDEDNTKRLNYGMIGAAGLSLGHLVFDLRYNYGFNNLLDADANNTNDNKPVLQTRSIALTLGYSF